MFGRPVLFVCAAAALVRAKEAAVVTSGIAPAATTVPTDFSDADVPLLLPETTQLTDTVIADLQRNEQVAQYADMFAFADSNTTALANRRKAKRAARCKTYPGDALWPSKLVWNVFNLLLGGALSAYKPIASVCYPESEYNNYDAAKCAYITNNWDLESVHYNDPGSEMFPLYTGMTCPQGTNVSAQGTCTQGGYATYSINVTNVAQIQLAVNFARSLNLRLVVRNTGHDYNGRSTGKDALSLWTHHLKDLKYISDYQSPDYSGPVFQVGAGIQGFELYQAAEKYGVSAVAGICPTVGVFGGYSTGGGHSPLMPLYGMGADQVISLQVVTASGRFVTASPSVNSDLYWAMLGGGGGTFGVITSAVVKVHPKLPVVTSQFKFSTSPTVSNETFWEAVKFFYDQFPTYNRAKTYSYFTLMNIGVGYTFSMFPFWAPNYTIPQFDALLRPFFAKLTELNIPYQIDTRRYDTVGQAYAATFGTIDYHVGSAAATPGNRLLPASNWADSALNNRTFAAVRHAVDTAFLILIYHQAPAATAASTAPPNSVNPAFRREASMLIAVNTILDSSPAGIRAANAYLTHTILGPLREATPLGGAYANEADVSEPDWQRSFWGEHYERLVEVKRSWDPEELFYVHHGVGSEEWVVDDGGIVGVQSQDGRLCRVG